MKKIILTFIFFAFVISLNADVLEFKDPVNFLSNHPPINVSDIFNLHFATNLTINNPTSVILDNSNAKLYNIQVKAMDIIASNHCKCALDVLIPFCAYSRLKPAYNASREDDMLRNTPSKVKFIYPAFAAIIAQQNTAKLLSEYALNKNNPTNYRVIAYNILSFVDTANIKSIGDQMEAEKCFYEPTKMTTIKFNAHYIEHIDSVKTGRIYYFSDGFVYSVQH